MNSLASRNLLTGILALQLEFITREQLLEAMTALEVDRLTPLEQILVQLNLLSIDRQELLCALVHEHLRQHDDDAAQSLAAVSSFNGKPATRQHLSDSHLSQHFKFVLSANSSENSPAAVCTSGVGESTSSGERFRILRPHARGGLGQVSIAFDSELKRKVALKEILPQSASNLEIRGRFVQEAEVTGGLEHPGIVPVYGMGTYADGRPFYAMRFIRGDSLLAAIDRFHQADWSNRDSEKALQLRSLLGRLVDVCNAIEYAHSRGVLHRDIKPSNIMVGDFGETLVVDWGLAKVREKFDDSTAMDEPMLQTSGSGSAHTLAGEAIGTPQYVSPEQAAGDLKLLGPATDVYSLGATLFHLLTGQAPIPRIEQGKPLDAREMMRRAANGEFPRVRELAPEIPYPLAAICQKAMSRLLSLRYLSARDLADDLEKWLADEPVSAIEDSLTEKLARFARKHRFATSATLLASLLLTLVATGAALQIEGQRRESERQRVIAEQAQVKEAIQRRAAEVAQQSESVQRRAAELANQDANEQRVLAETSRQKAERQLYVGQIARAAGELEAGRSVSAASILDSIPFRLRDWEARHLARRAAGTPLTLRTDGWATITAFCPTGARIASASRATVTLWDADRGKILYTLDGIESRVSTLAFSADGNRVIAGYANGTLKIWDASSGELLKSLVGPRGSCLTNGLNGSRMVSAGSDNTLIIWDVATGEALAGLRGHEGSVTSAAFSPDGRRIVSGGLDGSLKVWDARSGELEFTGRGHVGMVFGVAFSPEGRKIISCGLDKTLRLWDVATGENLNTWRGHDLQITCVAFSPDGRRIASGSPDYRIHVWDANTGEIVRTYLGPDILITSVAFSPDGRQVVSGGRLSSEGTGIVKVWEADSDEQPTFQGIKGANWGIDFSRNGERIVKGSHEGVNTWDVVTGEKKLELADHDVPTPRFAFSTDGRRIAAGGENGTIKIWEAESAKVLHVIPAHDKTVVGLAFDPDGGRIVSAGVDRRLKIWDADTGAVQISISETDDIWSVFFSPHGKWIASAGVRGVVKVWDAHSGECLLTLRDSGVLPGVAFSPDCRQIVTSAYRGPLKVWDVETGAELRILLGHASFVHSIAFSPSGTRMISGGDDRTVRVWDMETGECLITLRGHEANVFGVAFSPDGRRIVSRSDDGVMKLWDAAVEEDRLTFRGHLNSVADVALSPDGQRIASGSEDKAVKLWDAQSGENLLTLFGHERAVTNVSFSPDGRWIASGSADNAMKIWDAKSGREVWTFSSDAGRVVRVAFSPDNRRVMSLNNKGEQRVWDIMTGERVENESYPEGALAPKPLADGLQLVPSGAFNLGQTNLNNRNYINEAFNFRVVRKRPDYDPWAESRANKSATATKYHANQAAQAESENDWFAVEFHLRFLLAHGDIPNREEVELRLMAAREKLATADASN